MAFDPFNRFWLAVVALVALAFLAPALAAGAGFIVAGFAIAVIVLVLVIGPKGIQMWWQREVAQSYGQRAGLNLRDFGPSDPRGGQNGDTPNPFDDNRGEK